MLLKDCNIRDLLANRPTDNETLSKGRMFYPTDHLGDSYYDNGTGWDQVTFAATSSLTVAPMVLPPANGGTSYALPSVVANPTASVYFVRRLKMAYGTDYDITTSGGVSTLNILQPAIKPATGEPHELYAV